MFKRLTALSLIVSALAKDGLIFTAVLYRHGDRTPIHPYPTDPYQEESLWPVPFGQLTNIGKRQHYHLGKWLKWRYASLLSPTYKRSEIEVFSTDVDRTIMSALSNLAGMYVPVGKEVWHEGLMWQPIPVHTRYFADDEVLAMRKPCPAYDVGLEEYLNSEEYRRKLGKYRKLMNYLTINTGMLVTNFTTGMHLYSTLYVEQLYNFTLPRWTRDVFPGRMYEAVVNTFDVLIPNEKLARLKVGPFLQTVDSFMTRAIEAEYNGTEHVKMAVFSAHDENVVMVLTALQVFDGLWPPYTSTVFFELYLFKRKYYIKILYRNSTEIVEPMEVYLPNCGVMCPLMKYRRLYANLLTVNFEQDCILPPNESVASQEKFLQTENLDETIIYLYPYAEPKGMFKSVLRNYTI